MCRIWPMWRYVNRSWLPFCSLSSIIHSEVKQLPCHENISNSAVERHIWWEIGLLPTAREELKPSVSMWMSHLRNVFFILSQSVSQKRPLAGSLNKATFGFLSDNTCLLCNLLGLVVEWEDWTHSPLGHIIKQNKYGPK